MTASSNDPEFLVRVPSSFRSPGAGQGRTAGPVGLRQCVAMLRSDDPNARRKAVCALDRMTGQRARTTRLLAFALGDPCASVR